MQCADILMIHQRTRHYVYSILLIMLTLIHNVSRVSASFISRATFHKTKFRRRIAFPVCSLSNGKDTDNDASPTTARGLVGGALRRAMDTMATKDNLSDSKPTVQEIMKELQASLDESAREKERMEQSLLELSDAMLQGAFGRAMRTMSTTTGPNIEDISIASTSNKKADAAAERQPAWRPAQEPDAYLMNPAITPTALAHHMWSHALRSNIDTAIDATCGNGNDSVAIASMLFNANNNAGPTRDPQLLCIDIQQEACDVTRDRLTELLPKDTMTCNVNVLCTSHSPLPRPRDVSSVGLVCYNLGYLPQSDQAVLTQTETTISSIADAALLVRVGGLISVTTYPRSNKNEDYAVHALLEGLALLSSKSVDWRRDYVEELGPDIDSHDGEEDECYTVRDTVRAALERIVREGPPKQTWRVMENKMLGRALSPILLTATRIK